MHDDAIRRSAARLRWLVFAAMIAMIALYVAARFSLQLGRAHVEYRLHGPDQSTARLLADASALLLLFALFRLTQMLGLIAAGELFSARVIARFRSFAFWLLIVALLGVFGPTVAALFRHVSGAGLAVTIDFREILSVGVTLLLFLLARLLERAREFEAEMREIV